MPGCLGMDGLWQLVGFFPGLDGGAKDAGARLSVGERQISRTTCNPPPNCSPSK